MSDLKSGESNKTESFEKIVRRRTSLFDLFHRKKSTSTNTDGGILDKESFPTLTVDKSPKRKCDTNDAINLDLFNPEGKPPVSPSSSSSSSVVSSSSNGPITVFDPIEKHRSKHPMMHTQQNDTTRRSSNFDLGKQTRDELFVLTPRELRQHCHRLGIDARSTRQKADLVDLIYDYYHPYYAQSNNSEPTTMMMMTTTPINRKKALAIQNPHYPAHGSTDDHDVPRNFSMHRNMNHSSISSSAHTNYMNPSDELSTTNWVGNHHAHDFDQMVRILREIIPFYGRGDSTMDSTLQETLYKLPIEYLESIDHLGNTILMNCTLYGAFDLIRYLLDKGCNPNIQNNDGSVCLHFVCYPETLSFDGAQTLIDHGARAEIAEFKYGCTPLHWAASAGHVHLCELLCKSGGAIPTTTDRNGIDSIAYAQQSQNIECLHFLQLWMKNILSHQIQRDHNANLIENNIFIGSSHHMYDNLSNRQVLGSAVHSEHVSHFQGSSEGASFAVPSNRMAEYSFHSDFPQLKTIYSSPPEKVTIESSHDGNKYSLHQSSPVSLVSDVPSSDHANHAVRALCTPLSSPVFPVADSTVAPVPVSNALANNISSSITAATGEKKVEYERDQATEQLLGHLRSIEDKLNIRDDAPSLGICLKAGEQISDLCSKLMHAQVDLATKDKEIMSLVYEAAELKEQLKGGRSKESREVLIGDGDIRHETWVTAESLTKLSVELELKKCNVRSLESRVAELETQQNTAKKEMMRSSTVNCNDVALGDNCLNHDIDTTSNDTSSLLEAVQEKEAESQILKSQITSLNSKLSSAQEALKSSQVFSDTNSRIKLTCTNDIGIGGDVIDEVTSTSSLNLLHATVVSQEKDAIIRSLEDEKIRLESKLLLCDQKRRATEESHRNCEQKLVDLEALLLAESAAKSEILTALEHTRQGVEEHIKFTRTLEEAKRLGDESIAKLKKDIEKLEQIKESAICEKDTALRKSMESEMKLKEMSHLISEAKRLVVFNEKLHRSLQVETERRILLHNKLEDMKGRIRVNIRIRPLTFDEVSNGYKQVVIKDDARTCTILRSDERGKGDHFGM